eukprot:scaffold56907_cov38-Cyclotella_meneghiniana.AAC.1
MSSPSLSMRADHNLASNTNPKSTYHIRTKFAFYSQPVQVQVKRGAIRGVQNHTFSRKGKGQPQRKRGRAYPLLQGYVRDKSRLTSSESQARSAGNAGAER